jgi:hypothetical protein
LWWWSCGFRIVHSSTSRPFRRTRRHWGGRRTMPWYTMPPRSALAGGYTSMTAPFSSWEMPSARPSRTARRLCALNPAHHAIARPCGVRSRAAARLGDASGKHIVRVLVGIRRARVQFHCARPTRGLSARAGLPARAGLSLLSRRHGSPLLVWWWSVLRESCSYCCSRRSRARRCWRVSTGGRGGVRSSMVPYRLCVGVAGLRGCGVFAGS